MKRWPVAPLPAMRNFDADGSFVLFVDARVDSSTLRLARLFGFAHNWKTNHLTRESVSR